MSEKKTKEEMTEEYKKALEEKEAKAAKEREEKLLDEMRQKKSASQARREAEKKKKELETKFYQDKILECEAEMAKAEKILDDRPIHELIGRISLWISAVLLCGTVVLAFSGLMPMDNIIAPMIASWLILAVSVFFQSRTLFAESKWRKNSERKKELRQILLKNRQ